MTRSSLEMLYENCPFRYPAGDQKRISLEAAQAFFCKNLLQQMNIYFIFTGYPAGAKNRGDRNGFQLAQSIM